MDATTKEMLKQALGESSDSEDLELEEGGSDPNRIWERIKEIKGLWLCRDFLSPQRQSSLLSTIQNELHKDGSLNQAMRFGDLPAWAVELSDSIRMAVSDYVSGPMDLENNHDGEENLRPFPSHLLCREPLFDQLIMHSYQPGEGICAHIDLMRFDDGIAILSLESTCVMHFSQVELDAEKDQPTAKIPVCLNPGSVILMSGEARYLWEHEINRNPGFQMWEGKELDQKSRISVTLRKVCPDE